MYLLVYLVKFEKLLGNVITESLISVHILVMGGSKIRDLSSIHPINSQFVNS